MKKSIFSLLLITFLFSCVGTDEIDIEQTVISVKEKIEISPSSQAVLINGQATFTAIYTNTQGKVENVLFSWKSSKSAISTINSGGIATADAEGTTIITAEYNGIKSNKATLNVVVNTTDLAIIKVTGTKTMLQLGENTTLSAKSYDLNNNEISGVTYTWNSMNTNLATVDANGKVTASASNTGMANIRAMASGKSSNIYEINIFDPTDVMVRKGVFGGFNGYSVSGEVNLEREASGNLKIKFADNFLSASGPGLYVYLSNSNTEIIANGIEIQALTQLSGAYEINVSAIYPNVSITDYKYIIIHCKPFNIPFGGTELSDVQ